MTRIYTHAQRSHVHIIVHVCPAFMPYCEPLLVAIPPGHEPMIMKHFQDLIDSRADVQLLRMTPTPTLCLVLRLLQGVSALLFSVMHGVCLSNLTNSVVNCLARAGAPGRR